MKTDFLFFLSLHFPNNMFKIVSFLFFFFLNFYFGRLIFFKQSTFLQYPKWELFYYPFTCKSDYDLDLWVSKDTVIHLVLTVNISV